MAWFNPALYKFGNKKCPTCGNPVGWKRLWFGDFVWTEWRCPKCQSALGWDLGRRGMLAILIGGVLAVVYTFGDLHKLPNWAVFLGLIIFFLCAWWWLESVVLRRPAQAESKPPV